MSTRSGSFVSLRQLRQEIGNDACRFFFVMKKSEQHIDFDLQLATSQSSDNPLYYIQYAHARVCQVFKRAQQKGLSNDISDADLSLLNNSHERQLIQCLNRYDSVVQAVAKSYEVHTIAYYLQQLAHHFHSYYNACTFLPADRALRHARLALITASRQVIKTV